jgi:hypothetical protein
MADDHDGNVRRLLANGVAGDEVVRIAEEAVQTYDLNRKPKGAVSGAIGTAGCAIFRRMLRDDNYEPDIEALLEYRPFTIDGAAEQIGMSKNAAGPGINRLIEHGFADKRRDGRSFSMRLALPATALTEYAEGYLDRFEPNMAGYQEHQHLAKTILLLYPRDTDKGE